MIEEKEAASKNWNILFLAWLIATLSTLGALFIGEIMGQTPCLLCWYQRIFMFPLALLLGIALYRSDFAITFYALPLTLGGWLVAGFHVLLYFKWIPEDMKPCGSDGSCASAEMTILGDIPIPVLAFLAFTFIFALLIQLSRRKRT